MDSLNGGGNASSRESPFKKFVAENKPGPIFNLASMDPFDGEVISPLENSYETGEVFQDPNDAQNWVQYLDDETGHLYWYHQVTGETRWLTEEETNYYTNQQTYENTEPAHHSEQVFEGSNEYGNAEHVQTDDYYHQNNDTAVNNGDMIVIDAGPWEKYYDDDGNLFYYNKVLDY
jgi:hypothetical protein